MLLVFSFNNTNRKKGQVFTIETPTSLRPPTMNEDFNRWDPNEWKWSDNMFVL